MAPSRRKGASRAAAAAAARRQWKVGDLVLAKVKGFPAWPATVSEPEKWGYAADMKKVLVYFFGTQQIAFCNPADVEAFTEEKKESLLVKRHGKGADFVRAVHEIIESFEKLKKEDQVNNCNSTNEQSLISENNNAESLTKSFSTDEAPSKASQSFRGKTYGSAAQDVNAKPEDATAEMEDDMQDIEILSKEVSSGSMAAETGLVTYLTRGSQAQKGSMQRRPPSTRRTRSSSRIDANKLQNLMTTSGSYIKNAVHDGAHVLREGSARRNKRPRRSPDIDRHEVDSPDLVSNCSIEGDDSEILTADSDTLSLNEGSTVESDCNTIPSESVNELSQMDVELSQRLEFQTNAVINKKKRKPSRKRPTNDANEFTVKSDEKIASDSDIAKIEHNIPSDHERSTERYSRDDGDEHLPLVKRARVRMGRVSSIGDGLETSQDTEEKLPQCSYSYSELVHESSNKEGDGFMDQNSSLVKEKTDNSSPQNRCPGTKPQLWEVRKNQFVGSLDGEAALPPSKRLHRALEAMSANAAEDSQASSEEPSKIKPENIGCSPSAGFSKLSMDKNSSSEFLLSKADKDNNTSKDCSVSDCSAVPELPLPGGRISSTELAVSTSCESPKQEPMLESSDDKHHLESSCNVVSDTVVEVLSPNLPSPNHCEQEASINCDNGSQDQVMAPDDCNNGKLELVKSSAKPDNEISHLDSNHVSGSNDTIHSPNNATSMHMDCADDRSNETSKSCQLLQVENQDPAMCRSTVETGQTERGSSATSSSAPVEVLNASHENQNLHSDSASDGQSGDKAVSVSLSSSSLTDGLDSAAHTSTCNASTSDNVSIQVNGSCSPVVQSHSSVPRTAANWNSKEADNALASFEASLRTLTRTKESIGRATRVAIDCAKHGVAAKVVEILAHSLEHESSLHRRVDLFFLVDSIAQCSKGLKGEVGGIYPSAILAVLPRLLSAAAPPGSSSQENRRQCLKVLRVWQERRILPESIIRQHIRELDSLCSSSCSRAFSRRPLRNERSFDDPIREMEGMLVDEYGSNSSIQLPGFRMPPMLRDEDEGIDSDGENFEAVTPEHNAEKYDGERIRIPVVEKHRHILEDVDGELEMEDVAPSSEAVASTSNVMGTENQTFPHPPGNAAVVPFAPPLPQDVPPRSPPLPTSPPPPPPGPPPTSLPVHPERLDSISNGPKSRVYTFPQENMEDSLHKSTRKQLVGPGINSSGSDSIHYSAQGSDDFHPQGSKQVPSSTNSCSFSSPPVSNPVIRAVNNIPPADSAFNKGFRLRPPHPAPSNQFSYVQADQQVQSHRDIPPPSHPSRFHVPNAENGNFYRDRDRMKLDPVDTGERWRAPPFPGPRYPDASGMHYAPAPYAGQHREPGFPNQRWNFQNRAMNHRELMPYRPPAGGPIPVATRGHNFWRPR